MIGYIISSIAAALVLIYFYRACYKSKLPPGPFNFPILGYLPFISPKAPHLTFTQLARQYGPVYSFYLGRVFTVVISDAKIVKQVFSLNTAQARPELYVTHGIMNGYGLIGASGELWRNQRKFAVGCLKHLGMVKTSERSKEIEALIMEQVKDFIFNIRTEADEKGQCIMDPTETLRHNIGTILNLIIFGKAWDKDDATWRFLQHLQEEGVKHIGVSGPLNFLPFLRFLPQFKSVMEFLKSGQKQTHHLYHELILDQEEMMDEYLRESEPHFKNFIQLYLYERQKKLKSNTEETQYYSDQQLFHFLADLFGAGLDTTLVTLKWFLIYMAANIEYQELAQEEIHNVIGDNSPTLQHMGKLPFLEACIAEAQRIRSVVPLGIPHSNATPLKIEGYTIPPNTMIVPLQWAIHMDPDKWDNPEEYYPHRFINEEGQFYKPESFMPFQAGKRMCLGDEFAKMMLFLFSASILASFKILPYEELNLNGEHGVTLNPYPQMLIFQERFADLSNFTFPVAKP